MDTRRIDAPAEDHPVDRPEGRPQVVFEAVAVREQDRTLTRFLAAGAIALVAAVGLALLPERVELPVTDTVISPGPPREPSTPPPPTASEVAFFPPAGNLAVGWHSVSVDGVPFAVEIPAEGWVSRGRDSSRTEGRISKGTRFGGVRIAFVAPDTVYTDPCAHVVGPRIESGARPLAEAMSAVPGTRAQLPVPVTLLGVDVPVSYVEVSVREDIPCGPTDFYLWSDDVTGPRAASVAGSTFRLWIFGWGASRVVIEAEVYPGAGLELEAEIEEIAQSTRFNPIAPAMPDIARSEFAAQVESICRSATQRFTNGVAFLESDDPLVVEASRAQMAVDMSDDTFRELRALPVPDGDRDAVDGAFGLLEAPIDVLREIPGAAKAGDVARVESLKREHVDRTHAKDDAVRDVVWVRLAEALQGCPIALGA